MTPTQPQNNSQPETPSAWETIKGAGAALFQKLMQKGQELRQDAESTWSTAVNAAQESVTESTAETAKNTLKDVWGVVRANITEGLAEKNLMTQAKMRNIDGARDKTIDQLQEQSIATKSDQISHLTEKLKDEIKSTDSANPRKHFFRSMFVRLTMGFAKISSFLGSAWVLDVISTNSQPNTQDLESKVLKKANAESKYAKHVHHNYIYTNVLQMILKHYKKVDAKEAEEATARANAARQTQTHTAGALAGAATA